jgi:hypothetical protein
LNKEKVSFQHPLQDKKSNGLPQRLACYGAASLPCKNRAKFDFSGAWLLPIFFPTHNVGRKRLELEPVPLPLDAKAHGGYTDAMTTDHTQDHHKPYVVGVDLGGTNVRAAVLERASEQIIARGENLPRLRLTASRQRQDRSRWRRRQP